MVEKQILHCFNVPDGAEVMQNNVSHWDEYCPLTANAAAVFGNMKEKSEAPKNIIGAELKPCLN